MALVMLIDVSASVDDREYQLQKQGAVEALTSPAVHRAIWQQQTIAVTIIEWSSGAATIIPWRLVSNSASAMGLAADYAALPRGGNGSTAMGKALEAALDALDAAPCAGGRLVVDVSGDGTADDAAWLAVQTERARGLGVVVNGLPIAGEPGLEEFYRAFVAVDGFVLVADGFADFGRALAQKLAMEVAGVR